MTELMNRINSGTRLRSDADKLTIDWHFKILCGKIGKHTFHLRIIKDRNCNFVLAISKCVSFPFRQVYLTEEEATKMQNEMGSIEVIDIFDLEME